jgi:hypothetical protein
MGLASSLMVVFRNNRNLQKDRNKLFDQKGIKLMEHGEKTFNASKFESSSIYQSEQNKKRSSVDLRSFKKLERTKDFMAIIIAVIILYGLWNLVIAIL